jgi:asparagine synthase (glutamine-hydrolysing)
VCGISAVVSFGGSDGGNISHPLGIMHRALKHRGPDGQGLLAIDRSFRWQRIAALDDACWEGHRIGGAFRRLKIRDLTEEASQPMSSPDGKTWVLFNGEIYNFGELRGELTQLGHVFRTQGDTEVIISAYRQWGQQCFERFNGMWSILIFDLALHRLVGSRDRIGIKPLFYSVDGHLLLMASEAKAIALARSEGAQIEPYRLQEFLLGFPPQSAELSFFYNVHPVPAGTTFVVDLHDETATAPKFQRFWQLEDFVCDSAPVSFENATSEFLELLRSSVDYQSAADVGVGCLLSGGLDTSMISRLMAEDTARRRKPFAKTFSIVYDDPDMTERPFIDAVVAKGNLLPCLFTMTPELAWSSVDRVVDVQGQPLLGQDLIAQYHAYRIARETGATVVLDGQGADEMLGGMPYYETPIFLELIARAQYIALFREIQVRAHHHARSSISIFRQYVLGAYRRKLREWLLPYTSDWLDCDLDGGRGRTSENGRDPSALNRFLYRLVRHTNLPTVLLYQDRSSMAHGVESRVPFLDHRIVEFCFRLPVDYKISRGERKRILRAAAREYLPAPVLERKDKKVFISKIDWLPLRQHAAELRDMANSRTLQQLPWIRPRRMVNFVESYLHGTNDNILGVWRLYTAWRWLETTPFGRRELQC